MASEMDPNTNGNTRSQASFNSRSTASTQNLDPLQLSNATRRILSFKVQARIEALAEAKKLEREAARAAKALLCNEPDDGDFEEIGCGRTASSSEKEPPSQSCITGRESLLFRGHSSGVLSASSWKEVGADSSISSDSTQKKVESDMSACPTAPLKTINVSMSQSGVSIEESDDEFDQDWM
ncbi:MAG: hypothetical protein SGILL_001608 [Bacillariaceae sp.]